ncbi:signal peptidase I [Stieleria marina]|uniref:Signal peptidase I n=1 Tax=Stieleria marina TaxID=1930275 RepID=A0A517NTK0_9BACT|nr:Signal peptidase I [Planctomycetes bacterium K23_9]
MNRDKSKKKASTSTTDASSNIEAAAEPDLRGPGVIRAEKIRTEGMRETAEALVVAFILALLFRAFIAEAFVIPTGSMAPTLMGAHKDLFCDRCEQNFPVGASLERYENRMSNTVIGGVCPNCRHVNAMDLANNAAHQTFNGDRILVSKFAYALADPERFDVIVFKFPGNPKQNYIKRLVGLPEETLTVHHGDVYRRDLDADEQSDAIIRKPAEKLLAMRHHVYDTDFQSATLIKSDYPSRWQPWRQNASQPTTDSWQIKRDADGFQATVAATDQPEWLRYFHRWPSPDQWQAADRGESLAVVDPYSSRLITDFYAYNSFVQVPTPYVYDLAPGQRRPGRGGIAGLVSGMAGTVKRVFVGDAVEFNPDYQSGESPDQFGREATYGASQYNLGLDGMHWVGDLICETEVEPAADCKSLILELVEAGIQFQCHVDLSTGVATLTINRDGESLSFSDADGTSNVSATASTSLLAGSKHQIRFSNCDDQLLLWVDDDLISFDTPTTYNSESFLTPETDFPHYAAGKHPLDAAPVGIALQGGKGTIHRLRVDRDKYYIATKTGSGEMLDYNMEVNRRLGGGGLSEREIQTLFTQPDVWGDLAIWQARRSVSFTMEEDQFFPMGDNSPASLDARCWANTKLGHGLPPRISEHAYTWSEADYVPRDLLVGKALLVFWPHPWDAPVPMTPNLKRFKLIR